MTDYFNKYKKYKLKYLKLKLKGGVTCELYNEIDKEFKKINMDDDKEFEEISKLQNIINKIRPVSPELIGRIDNAKQIIDFKLIIYEFLDLNSYLCKNKKPRKPKKNLQVTHKTKDLQVTHKTKEDEQNNISRDITGEILEKNEDLSEEDLYQLQIQKMPDDSYQPISHPTTKLNCELSFSFGAPEKAAELERINNLKCLINSFFENISFPEAYNDLCKLFIDLIKNDLDKDTYIYYFLFDNIYYITIRCNCVKDLVNTYAFNMDLLIEILKCNTEYNNKCKLHIYIIVSKMLLFYILRVLIKPDYRWTLVRPIINFNNQLQDMTYLTEIKQKNYNIDNFYNYKILCAEIYNKYITLYNPIEELEKFLGIYTSNKENNSLFTSNKENNFNKNNISQELILEDI